MSTSTIKIIPLGGVRENGKNLYAVEVQDEIFILDCGLKYPENDLLGIDIVIPDFSYLLDNKEKIAGVFLTHGHADAIGALPYLLEKIEVPVFGTELTIELAKINVNGYPGAKKFKDFHVIDEFTEIDFEFATASFFRTTHTIPDSVGISLKTSEGHIVYTGDFKFDHSAIPMYHTDFARLAEIGKEGVLALLSDSTNAENPAQVASEREIAEEVYDTVRYSDGRIIVASVASNIQRVQQVLDAAYKSERKVVLTGEDLEKIIRTAIKLEKIKLPSDDLIIETKAMKNYRDDELVILETGRMGEPLKSLQRMANDRSRGISIKEGDLVYMTTTPSTAMETAVAKTEDLVYRAGGTVKTISDNFRVSGHANPNDLKLMLNLMKPKYFVPIQGEYRMLAAHADLAHELGLSYKDIYITGRGDILEYSNGRMHMAGSTEADNVMIDGLGVGDIGNIVLRDRRILSEDGVFIAVTTINRKQQKIVARPQITSRGFVYVKESKDLMKESADIVEDIIIENLKNNDFEWGKLKQDIREQLSRYLFEQTKRRPVILPVIMETSQRKK
ncbi:ribonuclease J [Vagococcus intermedius]|uniref:Ribonuclease J n=1 Tax=Vagococcus intermedius TaxID=2991418 RepID=A0AAF0CVM0_9ENTE|nr:ribonuclease J [Vagococcus intermedius]WEG73684.1 ribonuclease J [Vagococcus intermedius]WEG75768.1 ribonuclease J [Vagococcus intermedius]